MREHLSTSPQAKLEEAWKYKQRLIDYFPLHSFWASLPGTIRIHLKGEQKLASLNELLTTQELATIIPAHRLKHSTIAYVAHEPSKTERIATIWYGDTIAIPENDLRLLSGEHRSAIFEDRSVGSVEWSSEGDLVLYWILSKEGNMLSRSAWSTPLEATKLPASKVVGFAAHKTTDSVYEHGLLNEGYPFVQWLIRIRHCCANYAHGLAQEQFDQLISLLERPVK
jgi:hypothetical protein